MAEASRLLLIGEFTALFASAAYRFFERIYDRVLEAKDATIDGYERLTKTYESEREGEAQKKSNLEAAVNQLEPASRVEREPRRPWPLDGRPRPSYER